MHYKQRSIASVLFYIEAIVLGASIYARKGTWGTSSFEIVSYCCVIAMVIAVMIMSSSKFSKLSDLHHGIVVFTSMQLAFMFYCIIVGSSLMLPVCIFFVTGASTTYKDKQLTIYVVSMSLFLYIAAYALNSLKIMDNSYTVLEYVLTAVLYIICGILLVKMLGKDSFNDRVAREQEKSQDDLIKLVEMKCDEANSAAAAKSSFLANMSHEIRTPINAVLGMNEMILRESDNADILSYAKNVQRAGNTLLSLINDILDFSKIESGRMEVMPEKYELNRVLYDLILVITPKIEDKDLELNIEFDEETPNELYGDEVRIRQIITNLLTNAAKYTLEGSVTFRVGFEKGNKADEILLKVAVQDTGIGIKESKDEIISSFKRADDLKAHHIEGTGLGLSITQQLLRLMDSSLEMDSVYGEGSTFYFSLPQKVIGEAKLGNINDMFLKQNDIKKEYVESFVAPEAKVLVVDDNSMNRDVIKSLLKQTKVQIYTAADGKQCLDICSREEFDLILMDHLMPIMDGMEAFRLLREDEGGLNSKTKTIILTANAVAGMKQGYLKAGFDGFLSKPVEGELLEQTLMEHLPEDKVSIVIKEARDEAAQESLVRGIKNAIDQLEIGEVDFDDAVKYSSGFVNDAVDNIVNYVKDADNVRRRLISECESDNINDFTIHVHALKSTSRIVGAIHMAYVAERMEKAGRDNNVAYIKDSLDSLVFEYDDLVNKLKKLLDHPSVAMCVTKVVNDDVDDSEYLGKARAFLEKVENFDVDFNEIKEFANSRPESDDMADEREILLRAIEEFDYDGMRMALFTIIEVLK